jgi:hypothetical protein
MAIQLGPEEKYRNDLLILERHEAIEQQMKIMEAWEPQSQMQELITISSPKLIFFLFTGGRLITQSLSSHFLRRGLASTSTTISETN